MLGGRAEEWQNEDSYFCSFLFGCTNDTYVGESRANKMQDLPAPHLSLYIQSARGKEGNTSHAKMLQLIPFRAH